MAQIAERLRALGAHHDLVTWSRAFEQDWGALYAACPRGDWLLALLARFGVDRAVLVRAAASCAGLTLDYVTEADAALSDAAAAALAFDGSVQAVDACEQHAERLRALPACDDAVRDAVRDAVLAALASITAPENAAHAAVCAVHAAVLAAGECAVSSVLRFTQERTAERVRAELGVAQFVALASAA